MTTVSSAPEPGFEAPFRLEQEIEICAPRARAWAALLDVDAWWCHRTSGRGSVVVLEARVGGRFYERFSGDEGVLWGTVTHLESPCLLRLRGPLGSGGLVDGLYEYRLEERGSRTLLRLSHRCGGEVPAGARSSYDGGWRALWPRLRSYAENGQRWTA